MIADGERQSLHRAVSELRAFVDRANDTGLDIDERWLPRLLDIEGRIDDRPEVSVALLGGTGAGKSTLVNAVAEERLLPVASMRVTTAAITEVAFGEGGYTADVEFVDRESWLRELEYLAADIRDTLEMTDDGEADLGISRAAEDKIRLVYGDETAETFFSSLDVGTLDEPAPIAEAFDGGVHRITHSDPKALKDSIAEFVDSKSRFWPIVKRLRIRGPFPNLIDGAVLVDLPGLNDPNESRERATREHLESAQFVWVVFNMKRALTRDVFEFLRQGDLLRRLYVDGRTGSMTLIGTASDDIDFDNDIEEFGLDDDAETLEVVEARNNAVEEAVRGQLEELSVLLSRDAREHVEAAADLISQVKSAPIFCVSAREYQKCIGLMNRRSHLLTDPEITQIPALQEHLVDTVAKLGQEAHIDRLWTELELLRSDVLRLVRTRLGAIRVERESTQAQMEGVRAAATRAHTFLGRETRAGADGFSRDMDAATQLLEERLRAASRTAVAEMGDLRAVWSMIAWNTLRATARRGGKWVSRDRRIDMPAQIAKPMLQTVTFAWVDFFGTKSEAAVDVLEGSLRAHTDSFLNSFQTACEKVPGMAPLFDDYGRGVSETTRKLIDDQIGQLRSQIGERLTADRRQLDEHVTERIAAEMKPAFERAAEEKGRGMRDRMVEIIYQQASETAEVMFEDVRQRIEELLRDLRRFISKRVDQLVSDISRESESLIRLVSEQTLSVLGAVEPADFEISLERLNEGAPSLREAS